MKNSIESRSIMQNLAHQWALITGASSGIGRATALHLARQKMNLILIARRKDRLAELKSQLVSQHQIKISLFAIDIRQKSSFSELDKILSDTTISSHISVLINNAGLARGTESLIDNDPGHIEEMIDTNVKGLIYLTQKIVPYFIKNKAGHIVNLGSVAGRWVYPGGAVYCATKYAVRALSEGLRMDLLGKNIRVTNIEPGMVETEFSEVRFQDKEKAKKVYAGIRALTADDIADCIVWSLMRPAHVNIQEMVVFPTAQAGVGASLIHRE